jgi:uncharacterized protein
MTPETTRGTPARPGQQAAPIFWPTALYFLLLIGVYVGARHSLLQQSLGPNLSWVFLSFSLLLAPLWFFGFGAAEWIRSLLPSPSLRVLFPAILALPYIAFSLSTGQFRWAFALALLILPIILAALLEFSDRGPKLQWQDLVVLAVLAASHMLRLFQGAWPYPGLASLPKLLLIDIALYLYLVVRNLEGVGYWLIPSRQTFLIGLREWLYFLPFGIGLGAMLHFTHFHARLPAPWSLVGAIVLTFLLVAIPEEVFFRGVLQNLLETRLGQRSALLLASLLFGLGHFNKGAAFHWRYVLLATIAGIFYGRAWRAQRHLLASIITHTAVDVAWSLWFR